VELPSPRMQGPNSARHDRPRLAPSSSAPRCRQDLFPDWVPCCRLRHAVWPDRNLLWTALSGMPPSRTGARPADVRFYSWSYYGPDQAFTHAWLRIFELIRWWRWLFLDICYALREFWDILAYLCLGGIAIEVGSILSLVSI
jgi:hypothetical protein